jgi:hypothetical protein
MEDRKMFNTWQDYFDLGNDTERWWRSHVNGIGSHLIHTPRAGGYDFRGTVGDESVFIDVEAQSVWFDNPLTRGRSAATIYLAARR